ncbi:MAG: bifunctional folylpolyglutamate synthase/dihydrofolate synthase [Acholeplasmatales bacterium]|nr:bifunctional folylpolyglutamate synthase/dihydrofolate synthase [Acholeplasmatales bacterium]
MFNSANDAIYWIEHIKRKEKRTSLDRMSRLLNILGNPEKAYKTIHIAGTNGKGATAEFTSSILIKQGYNVGRFVSPYILRFNERIVVNKEEISDLELLNLTNFIYPIIEKYNNDYDDIVPFFEVVTLIGFLYFKLKNVDYAVIECGLGGKLDATNVIEPICSIIPSVGYDHMKVLGNTLEEIASHKLGIVKRNSILVTGVEKSLYKQFEEDCALKNTKCYFISKDDLNVKSSFNKTIFMLDNVFYETNLLGSFEALNASLAIKALSILTHPTYEEIEAALLNMFWPGRLELINNNPLTILDGGHNISAINEVVNSLKEIDANIKYNIIYTALSDKESDKVIDKLSEIANSFIITTIDDPRAKDPNILMDEVSIKKTLILDELEAYKYALSLNEPILVVGSLHFVSSLRKNIK